MSREQNSPEDVAAMNKRLAKMPLGGPEEMAFRIHMERLGVFVQRNDDMDKPGQCGNFALYPTAAKSPEDWEKNVLLHQSQISVQILYFLLF